MKEEERRIADHNKSKIEDLERQARIKQQQMKMALAKEYDQTIREKKNKREQDAMNIAKMDRNQMDIGTKLALTDGMQNPDKNYVCK